MLDLVDRWPMLDAWRARDFFARYVAGDPRFDPRDVWIAERDGAPLACVQIFPKRMVMRGKSVPMAGIGTVFTDPEHRGRGLAGAVMRAAMDDMRGRGLELGLLFAGPVPFYEALGWRVWPVRRPLLRPPAGGDPAALGRAERFDAARDLAEVQEIHARYSLRRDGTCLRDSQAWWTGLRNAGNPGEEFLVARAGGRVRAYLRATGLARFLVIMEWGRDDDAAADLADLFAAALTPREGDALAPAERPTREFRSVASATPLLDEPLERALAERGIGVQHADDGRGMFWVPQPEALAHRFGEPYRRRDTGDLDPPGARETDLLRRILPPERFGFWEADRF